LYHYSWLRVQHLAHQRRLLLVAKALRLLLVVKALRPRL
jgi:hypothetical protein